MTIEFPQTKTDKYSFKEILSAISTASKISEFSLLNLSTRKAKFVLPRQFLAYFSFYYTSLDKSQIGLKTGKHHTTVINSINRITDLLETNDYIAVNLFDKIKQLLTEITK